MKTVAELIEELSTYPSEAYAYAYEGEVQGIIIVDKKDLSTCKELGVIETNTD